MRIINNIITRKSIIVTVLTLAFLFLPSVSLAAENIDSMFVTYDIFNSVSDFLAGLFENALSIAGMNVGDVSGESVRSQAGNVYYVDQNHSQASDSNPGTSKKPFETIQKADDIVVAGDNVSVNALQVFPGAEGFGSDTRTSYAGNGNPTIYIVNTLSTGIEPTETTRNGVLVYVGSLDTCLEDTVHTATDQGRIILFEVSGLIDSPLIIDRSFVTVAGQTAPSPGIQIKAPRALIIRTVGSIHDILVQHIRFRSHVEGCDENCGNNDAGAIETASGTIEDVIVDHCTFTGGSDGNFDLWVGPEGVIKDVTMSNNIYGDPLGQSEHDKGFHGFQHLIYNTNGFSITKSIYIHGGNRQPLIKPQGLDYTCPAKGHFTNNIIYNPGSTGPVFGGDPNGTINISSRANEIILGNDQGHGKIYVDVMNHNSKIFINNTIVDGFFCTGVDSWNENCVMDSNELALKSQTDPITETNYTIMDVNSVKDYVLANAGAFPLFRDSLEIALINDIKNNTGAIKDCISGSPSEDHDRHGNVSIPLTESPASDVVWIGEGFPYISGYLTGREIEMTSGPCAGQIRTIIDYAKTNFKATVSPEYSACSPQDGDSFILNIDCDDPDLPFTRHSGGFPVYAQNTRLLSNIPSNPHADDDSDGYTNLEEWIHTFSCDVEGLSSPSCESTPYHKADTNNDNQIDMPELMAFITRWKANAVDVSKAEVEDARWIWFGGGGC